jgi:hypothetical protein
LTIDEIEERISKPLFSQEEIKEREESKILKELQNPSFAEFYLTIYNFFKGGTKVLDSKFLVSFFKLFDRSMVYKFMDKLTLHRLTKSPPNSQGELKFITPIYNENNQLKMATFLKKAWESFNLKKQKLLKKE